MSFFVLLVIACYYDYRYKRIPNKLLLLLFVIGIGRSILYAGAWEIVVFLVKVLVVLSLFYPLFQIAVIGAGDVKLLSICAGCLPFSKILSFLFLSLLIAAFFSLTYFIKKHNAKERFSYFHQYCREIMQTGKWHLYIENEMERKATGICLAGPILCSVLLCWGGVF